MFNEFSKLTIFPTLAFLSSLIIGAESAKAVPLTFHLEGTFEDVSLGGTENTLFSTYSGTYSYEEDAVDQDPTPNRGVYSVSDFDISIFDVDGNNSARINPSNGWNGDLTLATFDTDGSDIGDLVYSINFSRERISPELFQLRTTWNWFLEADVIPEVPPTGLIRPSNSFLAQAINPQGENEFYTVQMATVTPVTVPEPSLKVALVALGTLSVASNLKGKLNSSKGSDKR